MEGIFYFRYETRDIQFLQAEQNSVSELLSLLTRTIEALSFVLLLSDYRLSELIQRWVPYH